MYLTRCYVFRDQVNLLFTIVPMYFSLLRNGIGLFSSCGRSRVNIMAAVLVQSIYYLC